MLPLSRIFLITACLLCKRGLLHKSRFKYNMIERLTQIQRYQYRHINGEWYDDQNGFKRKDQDEMYVNKNSFLYSRSMLIQRMFEIEVAHIRRKTNDDIERIVQ